jgi:hypothetical protein
MIPLDGELIAPPNAFQPAMFSSFQPNKAELFSETHVPTV